MMTVSWGFTSINLPTWAGHLDIVVNDGSDSLEDELELALGGVGVVVEDFPEGFFTSLLHSEFYGLDAAEGIFDQLGVVFSRRAWRVSV